MLWFVINKALKMRIYKTPSSVVGFAALRRIPRTVNIRGRKVRLTGSEVQAREAAPVALSLWDAVAILAPLCSRDGERTLVLQPQRQSEQNNGVTGRSAVTVMSY